MHRKRWLLALLFGHNLTPTTYTLPKHQATVGTYLAAYGITDEWTIGTSPWMLINYNMPMIGTRYAVASADGRRRVGIDAFYFHTVPMLLNWYEQESTFLRLTGSLISEGRTHALHLSIGHQYFINGARPYSLRLIPSNTGWWTDHTFSVSALNEIHFTARLGIFLETGLLGINYQVPYLHLGASLFWQPSWGLVQVGASRSSNVADLPFWDVKVWHPEVQLQFVL